MRLWKFLFKVNESKKFPIISFFNVCLKRKSNFICLRQVIFGIFEILHFFAGLGGFDQIILFPPRSFSFSRRNRSTADLPDSIKTKQLCAWSILLHFQKTCHWISLISN